MSSDALKQRECKGQLNLLFSGILSVFFVISLLQVPELSKESIKRAPNPNAVAVLEKTITIQGK